MSLELIHEIAVGYTSHDDENVRSLAMYALGVSTPTELTEHLATAQTRADEWRSRSIELAAESGHHRAQQTLLTQAHSDFARTLRLLAEAAQ